MKNVGIFFFFFSLIFLFWLVPNIGANIKTQILGAEASNINAARYFPYFIGTIIFVISILIITNEWIKDKKNSVPKLSQITLGKAKSVSLLLTFCFIYVILLEPVGFFIMTPVCLFACLWFFGLRKWLELSMVPTLTTIFVFLCFEKLMSIQLPRGILGWMFF